MLRTVLTAVTAVLLGLFALDRESETAEQIDQVAQTAGTLTLERSSTVTIRTWLGDLDCRQGTLFMVEPQGQELYHYGEVPQVITLGPYPAGTQLVFAIQPGGLCSGNTWFSADRLHTRTSNNGACGWTLVWEDLTDEDFNDISTEITTCNLETVSEVVSQPFEGYKLPWPAGATFLASIMPGEGHHQYTFQGVKVCCLAYDFVPKQGGRQVTASSSGRVVWVEDSFGNGACPDPPTEAATRAWRGRTNVIVIQTEADVHLTYVHLQQGSARVEPGQYVRTGQVLASAGNSGFSCGVHLHFEWQHHCFDLARARKWRAGDYPEGKPTLIWSCRGFPPNAPFYFNWKGEVTRLSAGTSYISDNAVP